MGLEVDMINWLRMVGRGGGWSVAGCLYKVGVVTACG